MDAQALCPELLGSISRICLCPGKSSRGVGIWEIAGALPSAYASSGCDGDRRMPPESPQPDSGNAGFGERIDGYGYELTF